MIYLKRKSKNIYLVHFEGRDLKKGDILEINGNLYLYQTLITEEESIFSEGPEINFAPGIIGLGEFEDDLSPVDKVTKGDLRLNNLIK